MGTIRSKSRVEDGAVWEGYVSQYVMEMVLIALQPAADFNVKLKRKPYDLEVDWGMSYIGSLKL